MGATDNIKDIISRQKDVLAELEAEFNVLEGSDLASENRALAAEAEKLRADIAQALERASKLAEENSSLKNALYEQVYNEKVKLVNASAKKLDIFFQSTTDGELNRLTAIENKVKARVGRIREALEKESVAADDEMYEKLNELTIQLEAKLSEIRATAEMIPGAFTQGERDKLEELKGEQITDEQIRATAKKNNLERFVGLNVLNAVGIFLLIIGAITLARFTYVQLPDLLKGIMLFALGGVMTAAGELLNRKKANVFSLGISAGGIGILYAALATSYFGLHILDMYVAIVVCVLITAGAFLLSSRYNSQIIAAFALIGGYLPIFSLDRYSYTRITAANEAANAAASKYMAYGVMAYFVILNLLALLISFKKKWRISSFIGLILNIVGTVYIIDCFGGTKIIQDRVVVILYILFAYLTYTAIPIIGTYRAKLSFKKSDVVSLAINTLSSSIIMYAVFDSFGLDKYNGLLAVAFAAIYLLLGRFIETKFTEEDRHMRALFYLTGLAFVVLIVPLQFGVAWLSLGWLAEGVLLASYGILRNERQFKRAGYIISLLCLISFIFYDIDNAHLNIFVYKYLAITLGGLAIMCANIIAKNTAKIFVKIFKFFALANAWLYVMYLLLEKLPLVFTKKYGWDYTFNTFYLTTAAAITATFFIAYIYSRVKMLYDKGVRILSALLYILGIFVLFLLNSAFSLYGYVSLPAGESNFGIIITGTCIIAAIGILSVLAMRELIKSFVVNRKLRVEWYPLIISAYFVIILTQNLVTHYNLSFTSAIISIIYALTALAWIIFGFARRYTYIRKFGLGLAILSVIKLFLVDLSSLRQGYQIITYFALGISLIAISFVYQYFNKRLELKLEPNVEPIADEDTKKSE